MPTNETPDRKTDDDVVIVNNFARNHDPEDLIRYQGQWVAWSRDGRKILFASKDPYKLCEMVDAAGLKPGEYVLDGIPAEGYVHVGGFFALKVDTES